MCCGKFVALLPRDARSCSGGAISEANRGKVWRLIWLANCLEPACCCDTIRPEVFAAREFAKIVDSSTWRTRYQSTSRMETSIPTAEELRATDRLSAAQCETALLGPQLNCSWRAGTRQRVLRLRERLGGKEDPAPFAASPEPTGLQLGAVEVALGIVMSRLAAVVWVLANLSSGIPRAPHARWRMSNSLFERLR
jgi:hypothetical protein